MNERDELTALSIKLFRRLGDECDDSPTPNYEEDNYDAGYLAGLSRAQEIIRAEFPTIASGYRKVGADTDTHAEWGVRRPEKYGSTVAWVGGRRPAESLAESWGEGNVVVSRTVTVGPWIEVEQ